MSEPTAGSCPSAFTTCCSQTRSKRRKCHMADNVLLQRPEFVREVEASAYGVVEKPLTAWEKIFNNAAVRKGLLLILLAAVWQVYATLLNNPLLFPKFSDTIAAFYENIMNGVLLSRGWFSIKVLLMGYAAGLFLAGTLTAFAITSRIGNDFLETLTSMFNPLPAIALLPLALIWFGLGNGRSEERRVGKERRFRGAAYS